MVSRIITQIHQIEVTTMCNLRCRYCPHPKMQRSKEHMTLDIFEKSLAWVQYFNAKGTQMEVSLTGIGESLLHPQFLEMVRMLREVYEGAILFSTNGLLMTQSIAQCLSKHYVNVFVSTHRPEIAAPAVNICKRYGILAGVNTSFVTSALDWAGQVDWEVTALRTPCQHLEQGWGIVLVDGRISTCCMDSEGIGLIGSVAEAPADLFTGPFELCGTCNMYPPIVQEVSHANS